jgi:hypothetical protein
MTQQILQRETPSRTLAPVRQVAQARAQEGGREWVARLVRNLSPQDWLITTYFALFVLQVATGTGPDREHCMRLLTTDVAFLALGFALTRGEILRAGTFANAMTYRLTVWLTVFFSYFQLRHILPAVSERALDQDILAFDMRVFHVEPSLAWDRFVTPVTTEWFAFFYFGYFFLLIAHVIGNMLLAKDMFRLSHFATGIFMVFCTGHFVYTLVPGYGPYRFLAPEFTHELTGGPFWHAVQATVHAGGAQKDIFPSLHTAAPTFFALFSFRHRKVLPYKYSWLFVAFCATQIIGATMFLRWHYLVDICAGITLAVVSVLASEALVKWDRARRERLRRELGDEGAVQGDFEPLDYASVKRLVAPAPASEG